MLAELDYKIIEFLSLIVLCILKIYLVVIYSLERSRSLDADESS